jgi:hypothetical protein
VIRVCPGNRGLENRKSTEDQHMRGVPVVGVAQYAFVPTAGAVLADWGDHLIRVPGSRRGAVPNRRLCLLDHVEGGARRPEGHSSALNGHHRISSLVIFI